MNNVNSMKNDSKYKSVCLVGYRACGKTTVAKILAERLGVPAFDTDRLVENKAKKSIAHIFAEEGESAFRALETNALAETLALTTPFVLATGGGVVLSEENRRLLSDCKAKIVWLTARPETIFRRMSADAANDATRPALTTLAPDEEIRALLSAREPLYREVSDQKIATDTLMPEKIAALILDVSQ